MVNPMKTHEIFHIASRSYPFLPPWHVSRLTWPTTPALRTLTRLGLAGQGQVAWDGFQGRSSPETNGKNHGFSHENHGFSHDMGGGFDKKKDQTNPLSDIGSIWIP